MQRENTINKKEWKEEEKKKNFKESSLK